MCGVLGRIVAAIGETIYDHVSNLLTAQFSKFNVNIFILSICSKKRKYWGGAPPFLRLNSSNRIVS